MRKHINIQVIGLVQGVFFRASTLAKAKEIGLKGFVQNMPDGSVYIEAEGTTEQLFQLTLWCNTGPSGAVVKEVKVNEGEIKSFTEFKIERR